MPLKTYALMLFGSIGTLVVLAAYVTHYIVCIKGEEWILLAAGALIPPVGMIHGIMSWFGG